MVSSAQARTCACPVTAWAALLNQLPDQVKVLQGNSSTAATAGQEQEEVSQGTQHHSTRCCLPLPRALSWLVLQKQGLWAQQIR
jgi:hypothetical protein